MRRRLRLLPDDAPHPRVVYLSSEAIARPDLPQLLDRLEEGGAPVILCVGRPDLPAPQAAHAMPRALSGGMRMRVSIARALVMEPTVLFMDEPFAAVDAQTRITLQEELNRIAMATKKTTLLITHNVDEAAFLGDKCFVFTRRPGKLKATVKIDIPRDRRVWKDLLHDPQFIERRDEIMTLVREEVSTHGDD